jgi:hypothetical protein
MHTHIVFVSKSENALSYDVDFYAETVKDNCGMEEGCFSVLAKGTSKQLCRDWTDAKDHDIREASWLIDWIDGFTGVDKDLDRRREWVCNELCSHAENADTLSEKGDDLRAAGNVLKGVFDIDCPVWEIIEEKDACFSNGVFYDLEAGLPEGDFYWVLVDVFH